MLTVFLSARTPAARVGDAQHLNVSHIRRYDAPMKSGRIIFTTPPELDAALRRLARLNGQSVSATVRELLEGFTPVLSRTADVIEAAQRARLRLSGSLSAQVAEAQAMLERDLGILHRTFDEVAEAALQQSATPLSNRGVRSETETPENPMLASTYASPAAETGERKNAAR